MGAPVEDLLVDFPLFLASVRQILNETSLQLCSIVVELRRAKVLGLVEVGNLNIGGRHSRHEVLLRG